MKIEFTNNRFKLHLARDFSISGKVVDDTVIYDYLIPIFVTPQDIIKEYRKHLRGIDQ